MANVINNLEEIILRNRYQLRLLRSVTQEPPSILDSGRFVYLTRFATESIRQKRSVPGNVNEAVDKKRRIFESLSRPAFILSLVRDRLGPIRYHPEQQEGDVTHAACFSGCGSDILNNFMLAVYLVRLRAEFDCLMTYNLYTFSILPVLTSRFLLGKRVYVDLEDDYTRRSGFLGTKASFALLRRMMAGGIIINDNMNRFFGRRQKTVILNSFADLRYVKNLSLEQPLRLLYSGSLDDIRGADLIDDLCRALSKIGLEFEIFITGKGPLQSYIEEVSQQNPRLHFEGFVSEERLGELLSYCDIGLVLQKPDHPFSEGSFPSKVELYAEHNLAILALELVEADHRTTV